MEERGRKVLAALCEGGQQRVTVGIAVETAIQALGLRSRGEANIVIQELLDNGWLSLDGLDPRLVPGDQVLQIRHPDQSCSGCGHKRSRHADQVYMDDGHCDEEGCGCRGWTPAATSVG